MSNADGPYSKTRLNPVLMRRKMELAQMEAEEEAAYAIVAARFKANESESKLLEQTINTANRFKKKGFTTLYAYQFINYIDSEEPSRAKKDLRGLYIGIVMDWESPDKSVMWVNLHRFKRVVKEVSKSYMRTALEGEHWTRVDPKSEDMPEGKAFKELLKDYEVDPRGWIPYRYRPGEVSYDSIDDDCLPRLPESGSEGDF